VGFVVVRGTQEKLEVGKIVAAGQNYADHTKEMGASPVKEPILFLKPSTSIIHQGRPIAFPRRGKVLHHEVELGVVIGKDLSGVGADEAAGSMLGYVLALDLTLRDLQDRARKSGHPWSVAKGFDCACPISDVLPFEDPAELLDMEIGLKVDGEVRQHGSTADMLWSPVELVSLASEYFTLERGDVLLTGTPAGVGPLGRGNLVEAWLGPELTLRFEVE
jgi:2-keto-4-pentenoate hydratase/2-oxohepta-3-ene-1,7-dioic acid hydratase in catechol pathway